jgi:hypothetical protein
MPRPEATLQFLLDWDRVNDFIGDRDELSEAFDDMCALFGVDVDEMNKEAMGTKDPYFLSGFLPCHLFDYEVELD